MEEQSGHFDTQDVIATQAKLGQDAINFQILASLKFVISIL